MIIVHYCYYKGGDWHSATMGFHNVQDAKRFMWSLRYRKAIIKDYVCDDPEDNEWLNTNVSLYEINYGF